MWIKVTKLDDVDVYINADKLEVIYPYDTGDDQGCILYFNGEEVPLKTKTTFNQLDTLLNVNSIEKCIDRLKAESLQLKQRMQYREIFDELYGARAKGK